MLGDYIKDPADLWKRKCSQVIDQVGLVNAGTSTGSADAYVLDLQAVNGIKPPIRLLNGQRFYFIPNFTNAGATTVKVSDVIGAKDLNASDATTALGAGAITNGYPIEMEWSEADDAFRLIHSSAPGSSGGTNSETVDVDFGFASGGEGDIATATVSASWVGASTKIVCAPFAIATANHDPEDYALEEIQAYATNIQVGTSFDVIARAPNGTFGVYTIHCIGV